MNWGTARRYERMRIIYNHNLYTDPNRKTSQVQLSQNKYHNIQENPNFQEIAQNVKIFTEYDIKVKS